MAQTPEAIPRVGLLHFLLFGIFRNVFESTLSRKRKASWDPLPPTYLMGESAGLNTMLTLNGSTEVRFDTGIQHKNIGKGWELYVFRQ